MSHYYDIKTWAEDDGKIWQTMDFVANDIREEILRQCVNTMDAQIRKALIDLGWTPPAAKKNQGE